MRCSIIPSERVLSSNRLRLCIRCSACEKVCPIVDKPAVYVANAGATHSKPKR